jgi:DNA-binding NarL/FixJ family response regulator
MPTVLIADDNALFRTAIRGVLEAASVRVCGEAENGLDAIDKALEMHPDAVILDFAMPLLNGLEAAQTLKRLMPSLRLFMLTAHETPWLRNAAHESGFTEIFSKYEDMAGVIHAVFPSLN